jgi:hypothetical protein
MKERMTIPSAKPNIVEPRTRKSAWWSRIIVAPMLILCGACLLLVAIECAALAAVWVTSHSESRAPFAVFLWSVLLGATFGPTGAGLFNLGRRLLRRPFTLDRLSEGESLVLYLRPFKGDSTSSQVLRVAMPWGFPSSLQVAVPITAEEHLVGALRPHGRVVAVQRPSEWLPHLGAERVLLSADWKSDLAELIERSTWVVLAPGSTPGSRWELERLAGDAARRKCIVVLTLATLLDVPLCQELERLFSVTLKPLPDGFDLRSGILGLLWHDVQGKSRLKWLDADDSINAALARIMMPVGSEFLAEVPTARKWARKVVSGLLLILFTLNSANLRDLSMTAFAVAPGVMAAPGRTWYAVRDSFVKPSDEELFERRLEARLLQTPSGRDAIFRNRDQALLDEAVRVFDSVPDTALAGFVSGYLGCLASAPGLCRGDNSVADLAALMNSEPTATCLRGKIALLYQLLVNAARPTENPVPSDPLESTGRYLALLQGLPDEEARLFRRARSEETFQNSCAAFVAIGPRILRQLSPRECVAFLRSDDWSVIDPFGIGVDEIRGIFRTVLQSAHRKTTSNAAPR